MAVQLLRPTGTRSFYLTDADGPHTRFSVDRRGFGMPEGYYVPGQHLFGHDPVHWVDSQVRNTDSELTALVGLWASSRDFRRGLRFIKRTENHDRRYFGALRFHLPTWGSVSPEDILVAQLHYRVRPWVVDGESWINSDSGCATNKVGEARRLAQSLPYSAPVRQGNGHAWRVEPPPALALDRGPMGLNVLDVVREWHRDMRPGARERVGNLLLYPARPELGRVATLESVPLFPNRRRRTHWVRQSRWKVEDGHYEFRCASLLGSFYILMNTRD